MFKMGSHDSFGHLNTSYGQKKGRELNWKFDSQPLKAKNRPNFLACKWCATYRWKTLHEGYNFSLDLSSIRGQHTKLWVTKVARVPTFEISRLPLRSPGTKWHLGVGPVTKHKVYYTWEGGGFPQVRAVVSLVSLWLVRAPKCSKYALTNLLFGLWRSMWVIELLVNLPSPHPEAPARPSTPKMLQAKECAPTPFPSTVFTFWLTVHQGAWGCIVEVLHRFQQRNNSNFSMNKLSTSISQVGSCPTPLKWVPCKHPN
jgi:hypothetical protein